MRPGRPLAKQGPDTRNKISFPPPPHRPFSPSERAGPGGVFLAADPDPLDQAPGSSVVSRRGRSPGPPPCLWPFRVGCAGAAGSPGASPFAFGRCRPCAGVLRDPLDRRRALGRFRVGCAGAGRSPGPPPAPLAVSGRTWRRWRIPWSVCSALSASGHAPRSSRDPLDRVPGVQGGLPARRIPWTAARACGRFGPDVPPLEDPLERLLCLERFRPCVGVLRDPLDREGDF